MGFLSRVEHRMEDTVEGAAGKMGGTPLSPVQIAKKAEKQMKREKMVGAGVQYAPTLYTVLVNADDDRRLFGYYPTLAGETETYLSAKAVENGFAMDGQPLVRFVVDDDLKRGKFEVVAEMVAGPLVEQLREEEYARYGISSRGGGIPGAAPQPRAAAPMGAMKPASAAPMQQKAAAQKPAGGRRAVQVPRGAAMPGGAAGLGASAMGGAGYGGAAAVGAAGGFAAAQRAGAPYASPEPDPYYNDGYDDGYNEPAPAPAQPAPAPAAGAANPAELTAYLYDVTNDRAFTLSLPTLSIGREPGNDIVIPDINISRRHAEVREEAPGTWILTDLGSTNGTFVNGRKIKSTALHDADRVTLGATTFEFQLI